MNEYSEILVSDELFSYSDEKNVENKKVYLIDLDNKPDNYEAYVYDIETFADENVKPEDCMHYVGYHKGLVDDVNQFIYWHSSNNSDFREAIENAYKINYRILAYGSIAEMSTHEHIVLKNVDAKNNPKYFNNNNGGGKNVKAPKGHNTVHDICSKIKNKKYNIKLHTKEELQKIINEESLIQVRIQTDANHIKRLRENMLHSSPDKFDPAVLLMPNPENQSDLPIIIGGNHTIRAMIGAYTMKGIRAHEVSYNDWKNLSSADLRLLGLKLNPRAVNPKKETDIDDMVQWVISEIEEKKLYKNSNNLFKDNGEKPEPWIDHPDIVNEINSLRFTSGEKSSITKKVNDIFNNKWHHLQFGTNHIDWSEKGLTEDSKHADWLRDYSAYKKKMFSYDAIFKVSAGQHIWSQIEKRFYEYDNNELTGEMFIRKHPKNILVLIYFPKVGDESSNEWKKSIAGFKYFYDTALKNMVTITIENLPKTTGDLKLSVSDTDA